MVQAENNLCRFCGLFLFLREVLVPVDIHVHFQTIEDRHLLSNMRTAVYWFIVISDPLVCGFHEFMEEFVYFGEAGSERYHQNCATTCLLARTNGRGTVM